MKIRAFDDHAGLYSRYFRENLETSRGKDNRVRRHLFHHVGCDSFSQAHRYAQQIELAFFVHQLSRVPTVHELAETLHTDTSTVVRDLAAYQRLFDSAKREDLEGLPELPQEMRGAA